MRMLDQKPLRAAVGIVNALLISCAVWAIAVGLAWLVASV